MFLFVVAESLCRGIPPDVDEKFVEQMEYMQGEFEKQPVCNSLKDKQNVLNHFQVSQQL